MKKALIVKLGAIGDVVMAIPAAYELHRSGFEIRWVCGTVVRPLLASYSWIELIVVDEKDLFAGSLAKRARAVLGLWQVLSGQRYELCAVPYYDLRYRILIPPWISPRKVYLSHTARERRFLPGRHHTDEFARIVLGRLDSAQQERLHPVRPDKLPASPLPARSAPRRIGIVPGGASNILREQGLRRWPVDSYVAVVRTLISRGWEIVLFGGPDELLVKKKFEGLDVTDCIGKLTLSEVVSTFDTCDAVVSHDTGPLHLAGLSSAALVGLFGPTQPSMFFPHRDHTIGISGEKKFACSPCYDGRNFAPCLNNACMQEITPQQVLHELDRLLEQDGPKAQVSEVVSFLIL